jgi:queuine/archaeosine tRNA-ribosyltransferase
VLEQVGGAHKLQGWDRNILTDSGGYVHQLRALDTWTAGPR